MARILIVEDQERVAKALAVLLELHGLGSVVARGPEAALACLEGGGFDLVLQDMNFTPGATSGVEGLALFREIRARRPELPVLLLTAWPHLESAVALVRAGAADYVEKPWDDARLIAAIRGRLPAPSATARAPAARESARRELAARYDLRGLVYASTAMHDVASLAVRVAAADVPILIFGDSGTGKEKLAEIIHANSPRRARPFVRLDVGALPETLLEAELFGSEPGAYTGASRRRAGRFEAADGGTLLLDEIGNLSPAGQAKLLRVLQTGELQRLGSSQTVAVDVRILAATNVDLQEAIASGAFREDLYYRLAVIELQILPLRDRRDDVVPLAEHFLDQIGERDGHRLTLGEASRRALTAYDWPGNVRELHNRVQRAALLAAGPEVAPGDLGLGATGAAGAVGARLPAGAAKAAGDPGEATDDEGERRHIEAALVEAGGVVSRAAEALEMSRQALYRRMERLGIVLERRPRG
jgi:DNA-binding NtrC family response regulator